MVSPTQNSRNRKNNKLTLIIANEIRELYKTGKFSYRKLSKKYGVNLSTTQCIINNKIWK